MQVTHHVFTDMGDGTFFKVGGAELHVKNTIKHFLV